MAPIEKNIIVEDEYGNEYEATYPKRAKGLVKNGRARFIAENKICLACPPDIKTEDSIMSDNNNIINAELNPETPAATEKLTMNYVLEQIEKVQTQLTDLRNTVDNIGCVGDSDYEGEDTENKTVHDEVALAKIKAITEVFHHREESLQSLLAFYQKIYDDLNNEDTKKIGLINSAFETLTNNLKTSDLNPEDKFAALSDVTEKIAELTEKIVIPSSVLTPKEKFMYEIARVSKATDSPETREGLQGIIKDYLNGRK